MNRRYNLGLSIALVLGLQITTFAQTNDTPVSLGSTKSFISKTRQQMSAGKLSSGKTHVTQKVSNDENLELQVNYEQDQDGLYMAGSVNGHSSSDFFVKVSGNQLDGNIVLKDEKKAFKYYSDTEGNAYLKEVDIDEVLCIEYDEVPSKSKSASTNQKVAAVPALQSYPGARGCVLLDFDGHYVSGTPWNGGNPINAAPSGMSDADIRESWEIVAEDFRPFHLNVTTEEAVFNSYPRNRRMRCIITPTNTAAPGAGGVAYIGSFNWNDDTPCWTFMLGAKSSAEASSHEIGHTFGLGHDGRNSPSEGYYAGHGNWAPIMGVGYYRNISQWSRGEYNSANNMEDDVAKIASGTYGVGYRNDDHGNSISTATNLVVNGSSVSGNQNNGVIETRGDYDYFTFTTSGGNVTINVNTVSRHSDLDIIVRLHNASGAQIGTYNPGGQSATVSANLAAGRYYFSVDGIGSGNPWDNGYSDYASLGQYYISGTIPPGGQVNTNGMVTLHEHCNGGGWGVEVPTGDFTLGQLQARGYVNDQLSSISITKGFKATLFWDDNFTGATQTHTQTDNCLVDNGFNDQMTSIKVRPNGNSGLSGKYLLKNRKSGKYMDVANFSTQNGGNILQWNYTGNTNQQFEFSHIGDGVYVIRSVHSGKALDVSAISTNNGANIVQWDYVGGGNQKFIAYNNDGIYHQLVALHSGKSIKIAGNSNDANANVEQWDNNDQLSSQWELIRVNDPGVNNLIQAEDYNNMAGVQLEGTTDAGGGQNVGWIDTGDWMAYYGVSFPATGNYKIEYRVASPNGAQLSADFNAGTIQLGTVNIPATGGWQNWTTVSHTVHVNAGTYDFGIFAPQSGWNINWIRITSVQGAATAVAAKAETEVQLDEITSLTTFPNPAEGEVNIANTDGALNGSNMLIISGQGRVVYDGPFQSKINLSDVPGGIYVVKVITSAGEVRTTTFLKN